ncbi:MAG: 4Fe-4S dicluster domain-containing protein [candidate division WOR-3 bacterium]
MKKYLLTRQELSQLLDRLAKETNLYAPVKYKTGANWGKVKNAAEVHLEEVNTREPAKGFIFPRCEVLLRFDQKGNALEPEPPAEQIVFGVRPCDARAIAFLEKFYTIEGKTDPYVKARREKTTFIGLACNRTAPTCFCLALGGSPHDATGMDLLLTDLGDLFLAEPLTAKGEKLIAGYPEAKDEHLTAGAKLREKAEAEIPLRIDTAKLQEVLPKAFASKIWETLALNCVNCGACTFLCPTCHCFDVTDETVRGSTVRCRVWDSCQFTLYSRHASGHNPRLDPRARYRNRVMDKFYYTVEQAGAISCVGCGRCIIACPANIDIRTTVERLLKEFPEE